MALKNVLVINCGSSSIKFQIVDPLKRIVSINGIVERLGSKNANIKIRENSKKILMDIGQTDHKRAFDKIFDFIVDKHEVDAVGHRVVHGGRFFTSPVLIDGKVKERIKALFPLAPIHNPKNLMGIELMEQKFGKLPQVAVFDTSFHVKRMPEKAFRYAVPEDWYTNLQVRRYGFHGTSHQYVAEEAAKVLAKPLDRLSLISAHLGHGCSVAAIKNGKSLDTSMGFSPLEGLIMGSRSGDIDANVLCHVAEQCNIEAKEVAWMLNDKSGFGAVSGVNDSRDLESLYFQDDERAVLAVNMFCYRIAKYIASYVVSLASRPDALIFTAGIGERSPLKRKIICDLLEPFGVALDHVKNEKNEIVVSKGHGPKVLVIPTNEELKIAQETLEVLSHNG